MLPVIAGLELMEHMSEKRIPVIYLTAKNDVFSKVKGLKSGAEDYIVKPFEAIELLVRVEKVLERHGTNLQVLKFADVEIELEGRNVKKSGKIVELKPQEYELLIILAKNKNIALSRDKLLNAVWDVNYEGETRTVDVHISRLRKKLGLSDVIRTVSKTGYRLED